MRQWSLTTPREKLVKIEAKVTRHSSYVAFHLAEVAVPEYESQLCRLTWFLGVRQGLNGYGVTRHFDA
jgi:hypothetical protein